jgi:hypothetical protein
MWNVKSLYRVGSLMTVSKELGDGTEPAGEYTFFYGKGNDNHEVGTSFLCIRDFSMERGMTIMN